NKNNRNWKLKRMAQEESEMAPRKQELVQRERDYEMFLRDVEEDEELRAAMALYRNENKATDEVEMETDGEEDEDRGLAIPMEQLLDDMEEMNIQDHAS
ncbi:hypothetical protein LTR28_000248, partial [Elasticomyces elasticus]